MVTVTTTGTIKTTAQVVRIAIAPIAGRQRGQMRVRFSHRKEDVPQEDGIAGRIMATTEIVILIIEGKAVFLTQSGFASFGIRRT